MTRRRIIFSASSLSLSRTQSPGDNWRPGRNFSFKPRPLSTGWSLSLWIPASALLTVCIFIFPGILLFPRDNGGSGDGWRGAGEECDTMLTLSHSDHTRSPGQVPPVLWDTLCTCLASWVASASYSDTQTRTIPPLPWFADKRREIYLDRNLTLYKGFHDASWIRHFWQQIQYVNKNTFHLLMFHQLSYSESSIISWVSELPSC